MLKFKIRGEEEKEVPIEFFLKRDKEGNIHLMCKKGVRKGYLIQITTEGKIQPWYWVPEEFGFKRVPATGAILYDEVPASDADYD